MTHPGSFWVEFEQYLRSFYADLSPLRGGDLPGGNVWFLRGEGTLYLSVQERRDYVELLKTACRWLAPDASLSETAIDSALRDAIFAVADVPRTRATDLDVRIRRAVDLFRTYVKAPAQGYRCWIEIERLDRASLPAEFGLTRFVVLGTADVDALKDIVDEKHLVDREGKVETVARMAGEIEGRVVAVERVRARDQGAALAIANREVQITLECLNFFADIVPYNHARLRVSRGSGERGNSLQFAIADDGSFVHSPQTTLPWEFSFERLRGLTGAAGRALERVDALRRKADRDEVEELLVRAVRWVGRAVAAERTEDKFLFSMVALDCITRPTGGTHVRRELSSRAASLLSGHGEDRETLQTDVSRLFDIRSALVHDGSLEVTEDDRARLQTIALRTVVWALTSSDVERATTLPALETCLKRITVAEPP